MLKLICPICRRMSCAHTQDERDVFTKHMTRRQKKFLRDLDQTLAERLRDGTLLSPQQQRELRAQVAAANRKRKQKTGSIQPVNGYVEGGRISPKAIHAAAVSR